MSHSLSRRQVLGQIAVSVAATACAPSLLRAADESNSSPWKIGCFTRPWKDDPYPVAFDAIAEAGFKYVGFMTTKTPGDYIITYRTPIESAAKAGEEAKKRGLEVIAAWGGGLPVQNGTADGVTALRKLIDNAHAAGVATLLMGGTTNAKQYDDYYKAISECCDYAAEQNVALVIKPHGGSNSNGEQCRKTVEKVGKKNFRIWYDPGNIYFYSNGQLDPIDDAKSVAGIVTGMCVKDYKHPMNVDVTPGEGMVKFDRVMAELKKGGFMSGPLVVETLGPIEDPKKKIAEAKKARQLVEQMVKGS